MSDLWIPDVSEFQDVDWDVFNGPVIVRAHNSNRPDRKWAKNAPHAARQPWWGAYQYLTRGADPAAAARNFLATLGGLRPNVVILDLEEGDGDQQPRQHAWLEVMAGDTIPDWTYSGAYFARAHNLGAVEWIAAYQRNEPTVAHKLWQATDNHVFPGIGACDGSLFHGSIADLIALTGGSAAPPPVQEDDDMAKPQTFRMNDAQGTVYAVDFSALPPVRYHVKNTDELAVGAFLGWWEPCADGFAPDNVQAAIHGMRDAPR